MFGSLKDKLKKAVGKFTADVKKESVVETREIVAEEMVETKIHDPVAEPKKKGFFEKIFGKRETEDIVAKQEEIVQSAQGVEGNLIDEPVVLEQAVETLKPQESKNVAVKKKADNRPVKKDDKLDARKETYSEPKPLKTSGTIANKEPEKFIKKEPEKFIKKEPEKFIKKEPEKIDTPVVAPPDIQPLKKPLASEERVGFFTKITETFTKFQLSDEKFDELFWELELVMLENNVAVEVIEKIKADMKKELMEGKIARKGVEDLVVTTLRNSIIDLFDVEHVDLLKAVSSKKPFIIAVIGVNGSGKTTSIAKLTNLLQKNGLKVVLAAADTFRAAAIQQLEEHANRLNTKLIKHDYNSDPAAVAFDAVKYAQAKEADVVIIDTAGRLHSNTNLMRELEKVVRVSNPDMKIFVGESITGNDCVEQAKEFDKAVGIDAIILAKADVDEKGGAAISVSYVTKKPILYLGTGQTYDDLKLFDPKMIIDSLEL